MFSPSSTIFLLFAQILSMEALDIISDRSVSCTASAMNVILTFNKPFNGGIFTEKGYTNSKCRWQGNGEQLIEIKIPILNTTECGVLVNEKAGEYTVKLMVSPVKGLLVDGFAAISVRCLYSTQDITLTLPPGPNGANSLQISGTHHDSGVITGSGGSPLLSMQILDGHGIDGPILSKAAVGQRITLDLILKNTAIYDFFVHSCYAHDGSNTPDASITIIDNNGCGIRLPRAIDAPVATTQPVNQGPKHIYVYMYGFQFTSSSFVHFECQIKPCVHSCKRQQCQTSESVDNSTKIPLIPALRRRREENLNLSALRLQTVLEIQNAEPKKAALISAVSDDCFSTNSVLLLCSLVLATSFAVFMLIITCWRRKRQIISEEESESPYHTSTIYASPFSRKSYT